MIDLPYAHVDTLTPRARDLIRSVVHREFPGEPVRLFAGESPLPPADLLDSVPNAEAFVVAALKRMSGKMPKFEGDILFLDIETHGSELRWDMPREQFIRLCQYAWGEGPVQTTTSLTEFLDLIERARLVVAHNGHAFDFSVLCGDSALDLAAQKKLFDTWVFATVNLPAPHSYVNRYGRRLKSDSPKSARGWFSLDNLAFQFGIPGKLGDITELARRFNPKGTPKDDLDYGLIPVDDPDFLAYAEQDIVVLRELLRSMWSFKEPDKYDWRSQFTAAIYAQMTRTGVYVDIPLAQSRVDEQEKIKQETLEMLARDYNFPTEGSMPWRTKAGKDAIFSILKDNGITPKSVGSAWTKTKTGNPSLSGDTLLEITKGTPAEELGVALARVSGQRPLAQQALDYVHSDGKVHPDIDSLQRSRRCCLPTTHRILTKRGILSSDEVRVGDETLDMRNNWVKITQVHRFSDSPVTRYETRSSFLEATDNHRWVTRSESGDVRTVGPVAFEQTGKRRVLQLTPDCYPFDRDEHFYPQCMTDRERIAALVGLLITDGSCQMRTDGNTPYIRIYQTEGKYYQQMKSLLPGEWVANDYARPVDLSKPNAAKTSVHTISLKQDVVGPMLRDEGLDFSGGLRHSSTLLPWLLRLNQHETLAFLTSVYMADGRVAAGGVEISSLNENVVPLIQIAAYRCGRRSNYRVYDTVCGKKGVVHLLLDRVGTRSLAGGKVSKYNTDVWCVSTETGTFTAWYPDGRWSGPYLTGNSVTAPGMTTFDDRDKDYFIAPVGWSMCEVDLESSDARGVAAMSGDPNRKKWFEDGADSHEIVGRLLFGDEEYEAHMPEGWETDPHIRKRNTLRQTAKKLNHSSAFNAGAKKLSEISGDPLEVCERFLKMMDRVYPKVTQWRNQQIEFASAHGYVETMWGARLYTEAGREYNQGPALPSQNFTTEVLNDTLIRLYMRNPKYIRYLCFPIHDALLVQAPDDEIEGFVQTVLECAHTTINGIEILMDAGTPGKSWAEAVHR